MQFLCTSSWGCRVICYFYHICLCSAHYMLWLSGMCSRTTWSSVEAKARGLRGEGHKILSSRCTQGRGQSLRTPIPGLFYRTTLRRERLCQVVCLSITLNALLPPLVRLCMNYEVFYLWYCPLLTILKNSTSYGQILKPKPRPRIVKAKAKGLKRPRPQNFVLEVEASPRGPHP